MDIHDAVFAGLEPPEADSDVGVSGVDVLDVDVFDVDGDGSYETRVSTTDAGVTVAEDRDVDGVMDTFTTFGRGGHYESWEIFRATDGTSRWELTASGDLFSE